MTNFWRSVRAHRQNWLGAKRHVKRALSLPGLHHLMRVVAPRVPSVQVGRLPAPASLREVRGVVDGGDYVLLDPSRCEIAKEMYWGEGRRPDPGDALALDVVVALAGHARTFVDIGAYTGVFTLAATAAHPQLRVHAFEIVPSVTQALEANVRRNDIEDRAVVHSDGIGAPETSIRVPRGAGGSALPSFFSAEMEVADGVDVDIVSLDSLTDEVQGPVVMKVDIEGGETTLFRHGQEFLARHRPDILCEVLPSADAAELDSLFAPHQLHRYLVRDTDVALRASVVPHLDHRDWLVTPRKPAELAQLGVPVADG